MRAKSPRYFVRTAKELDEAIKRKADEFSASLKLVALKVEPEDKTKREVVFELMEKILALRLQGYSISQITTVLNQSALIIRCDELRMYIREYSLSRTVSLSANLEAYLLSIAEKYESLGDIEFAKQIRENVEGLPYLPNL